MTLPDRSVRLWLLGILPLAWASSALLVLGDGSLSTLVGLAWLGLAWKYFAGRRAAVAKRALALLVAFALTAQGFAALAAEVSGPGHFHAAAAKAGARHWHAGVMHHHHALGDAVIVDDGKRSHPLAAGDVKCTALGDALTASGCTILLHSSAIAPALQRVAEPAAHVASPPERPPGLPRSSLPV
jgi:hypothetical protein